MGTMMERVRDLRAMAIMVGLFLVGGCYQTANILTSGQVQEEDGGPSGLNPDGDPGAPPVDPQGPIGSELKLDLLLMVDSSNSMQEEQATIGRLIPDILRTLISGDLDRDGVADAVGIPDIQVGVISGDMGTGRSVVPTCSRYYGDDGLLRSIGSGDRCEEGGQRSFLRFDGEDGGFDDDLLADSSCVTNVGLAGCGFEQPLDSILKSLSPSTSPLRFRDGTVGHGDGANHGFLRQDSTLAIIMISDEDDCSTPHDELFDSSSPFYTGGLNLRCFAYPDQLHPVHRFVEGIASLREGRMNQLVFMPIVGIPDGTVSNAAIPDYESVLTHPRMVEQVDPADPTRLMTVCQAPGYGKAYPARRIVRVAQSLDSIGATTLLGSICEADGWGAMLNRFAEAVLRQAQPIYGSR